MIAAAHPLIHPESAHVLASRPEHTICDSPSIIAQDAGQGSFELKFLLPVNQALAIEEHFSGLLQLDLHAAVNPGQRYNVRTIYTDTPDLSVYHRQGNGRRHKYRIRCYGDQGPLYVEQKTKQHGQVSKRRRPTTLDELRTLNQASNDSEDWFLSRIQELQFHPVAEVSYVRRPWFGTILDQPVRLTFDAHLQARAANAWTFDNPAPWVPFPDDMMVCEMKFLHALPIAFKQAIEQYQLIPGGCSKYRRSMELLGLAQRRERVNA